MLHRGIALAVVLLSACSSTEEQEVTTISAWYEGALYLGSYRELEGDARAEATLYQSDPGLTDGSEFVSVLDTLGGPNPVWREVQVSGNQCGLDAACAVPHQYTSADEIAAAVAAFEVHLVETRSRCSVVDLRVDPTPQR